jgi:hypothetical protein
MASEFEALTQETKMTMTTKMPQVCAICHEEYEGHGNNAEPAARGRCCDQCNARAVIPARLRAMMEKREEVER